MHLSTLLILFLSIYSTCGYKMVIFVLDVANSQLLFNKRVAEVLADAGHDVTMVVMTIQPDRDNTDIKIKNNVRVHVVNSTIGTSRKEMEEKQEEFVFKELSGLRLIGRLAAQTALLVDSCRATLEQKDFIQWLKNEHFDLAFAQIFDVCHIGLVHEAKIPGWIWMSSGALIDWAADLIGVPNIPSYVPPVMMEMAGEMNFMERTKSLIGHVLMRVFWKRLIADPETELFRKLIRPDFPNLLELAAKTPLAMANTNDLYDIPRPTLAKVVNIGGIGMELKDLKPLPEEIKKIMDKGEAVVLFSFGSVAPAHRMPREWKEIFMETFRKFPNYQFLMRYEKDDLKDLLPPNVHLFKWLPQSDILRHPKTKAFITHGGYNSVQESILTGVPLIVIPLFGDQPKNARLAERHGLALILHKSEVSVEAVSAALKDITADSRYLKDAQRLSRMVDRRPISPAHLLVKWSEFVAEFQTLENLEPAGNNLSFFQYHSLDVVAFLLLITTLILLILSKVIKLLYFGIVSIIFRSRKQKVA